ncbi:Meiotic recombination, Spo, partial [Trema orientale]
VSSPSAGCSDVLFELTVGHVRDETFELTVDHAKAKTFEFTVLLHTEPYHKYVLELERYVLRECESVLDHNKFKKKNQLNYDIIKYLIELCDEQESSRKRSIFYINQNKALKQDETDRILNDIATSLHYSRTSLPISAVPKGVVIGCLKFKESGSIAVDCTEVGDSGKEIPYSVSSIMDIENKGVKFILLVEKDTVFLSLLDHKFYEKVPCIIITGKGTPDVSTRSFLRRLKVELYLPILGLVNGDVYGVQILSVYSYGSKQMPFDNENLVTPNIRWLDIWPSDIEKYDIPDESVTTLSEREIGILNTMLSVDAPIEKNRKWKAELTLMINSKKKVEIEALYHCGPNILLIPF